MKIWKKLLLGTATLSAAVSVPVLLASCSTSTDSGSSEQYSSESADVDASVMVSNGTNDRTMSDAQNSTQQERFQSARTELQTLQGWDLSGSNSEHSTEYVTKLTGFTTTVTTISGKATQYRTEALGIESSSGSTTENSTTEENTGNNTNHDTAYNAFWNKVATEYKTQNIGYLFVSKEQFLSTYKTSYVEFLSTGSATGTTTQDTNNDNQLYSTFISDYLNLASLKEELLIYAYAKKTGTLDSVQNTIPYFGKDFIEKEYGYFTHNIRKEVNGLWFLVDYTFTA
ncbi:hypothetical protein [Malacoplasma penetrans]|uniref:Lipoprotein n=1 Tax=Malacoplasma penetrans (strain HF-2) TaxID=272633 RepID=Q8EV55_MALP2|nr:hypothetical protein [Malacoplasma penetrans]BAC44505.1 hypothetical protein [Malacoplasma penetrans HF-2]